MVYRKRKRKELAKEIRGYPVVESYKYLGIWIDNKLSFDKQIKETERKIEKGMKMINIMKWKKTTTWKKTYAWMTYIVP